MMAAASDESDARPGMVAVIETFGSSLKFNPHIHAIVTRGVFLANGQWHPIPYVDTHKAQLVFRHKILALLRDLDLISEERIDLLLSWRHSGFNIHNHTTVYSNDTEGLHPWPAEASAKAATRLLLAPSASELVTASLSSRIRHPHL